MKTFFCWIGRLLKWGCIAFTALCLLGLLVLVLVLSSLHRREEAIQDHSFLVLNLAEGSGSAAGTRTARYRTALGSARETGACLDVAEALGYFAGVDATLRGKLAIVVSGLVKLTT